METVGRAACRVLEAAAPEEKAARALIAAAMWRDGALAPECDARPPPRPARPDKPKLLPPRKMPKRRKAGSKETRIALVHAIAHIECNAIDLAFDIIARFGAGMPSEFAAEWLSVGADEARHFTLLADRLEALGAKYGDLPAHGGLWEAAGKTADDLLARLAVVPLVLEARGLDVTPAMIARLEKQGDAATAKILKTIYRDEIGHVKTGAKWFRCLCEKRGLDPKKAFQELVNERFDGTLKAPFNRAARDKAGLPYEFYAPLAK